MSFCRLFTFRCGQRGMPSFLHCFFRTVTPTLSSRAACLIGTEKCRDTCSKVSSFFVSDDPPPRRPGISATVCTLADSIRAFSQSPSFGLFGRPYRIVDYLLLMGLV